MKKILVITLKVIKWLFFIFIIGFIVLLISIYISSLNSYKESEFNIPKDFFDTKFGDKDPYSKENGFNDFLKFKDQLNNKDDLPYFNLLSRCTFDKEYINNGRCIRDTNSSFKKYKDIEILKILKKETVFNSDKEERIFENKYIYVSKFYSYFYIKNITNEIAIIDSKIDKLNPGDIEFYKVFDYIDDKKAYSKYKKLIDAINSIDNDVKTLADIGRLIDKINFGIQINESLKVKVISEINSLYNNEIDIVFFKKYRKADLLYEKNKQNIFNKKFNIFRTFVGINRVKYKKINNKKYILQTPEYSGFGGLFMRNTGILQYSRVIRYTAYRYFLEGKYENGINILLEYQGFIDNLIKNSDFDLMLGIVITLIDKINIEGLEYFIDNYNLSNKLKEKIIIVLENKRDEGIIKNSLKRAYINTNNLIFNIAFSYYDISKTTIDTEGNEELKYKSIKGLFEILLFFSKNETDLLLKKSFYDLINTNGLSFIEEFCEGDKNMKFTLFNLNNYIGKRVVCYTGFKTFSSELKREEDIRNLRSRVLEKLK